MDSGKTASLYYMCAGAGKPYLDLLPHRPERQERIPGQLKGAIRISKDFDTTPDDLIAAFEGRK